MHAILVLLGWTILVGIISMSFAFAEDRVCLSEQKNEKYKILLLCIFFNVGIIEIIHRFLFGYWNVITTVKRIVDKSFLNHQLDNVPTMLLVGMVASIFVGYIMRMIAGRFGRENANAKLSEKNKSVIVIALSVLALVVIIMYYYCFSTVNQIIS